MCGSLTTNTRNTDSKQRRVEPFDLPWLQPRPGVFLVRPSPSPARYSHIPPPACLPPTPHRMEVIPWTPEELEALESLTRTWPRGSPKWHDELFCATWFMRPVLRARSVQEVMDWGRNPPPPPPTEDDNER